MRPPESSLDLLTYITEVGSLTLADLAIRAATAATPRTLVAVTDALTKLKNGGYVEVTGDSNNLNKFTKEIANLKKVVEKLEDDSKKTEIFQRHLYEFVNANEWLDNAHVNLLPTGFGKARRIR